MKRLLTLIMACAAIACAQGQTTSLKYNIVYRWGFIEKVAAHATVTLTDDSTATTATLNGMSIPWGGLQYCVSDTLKYSTSVVAPDSLSQQVSYISGWYFKPPVGTSLAGYLSNPAHYRTIGGAGTLNADASTIEAVTICADMLGFYSVVKYLPFDTMQPGDCVRIPISMPDGKDVTLEVTYHGLGRMGNQQAYTTVFNYSYGGQMSAYPVVCLVSTDTRTPLSIATQLLIGHVDMQLAPGQQ